MKGFTQLPRHILETSYGTDMKLFKAWAVLLICARFSDCEENGIEIKAGQALFTKIELQKYFETDLRGVRSILKKFSEDGNIEVEFIGRNYTLITLINPALEGFSGGRKKGRPAGLRKMKIKQTESIKEKESVNEEISEKEENKTECNFSEKSQADEPCAEKEKPTVSPSDEGRRENGEAPREKILCMGEFSNVRLTEKEFGLLQKNVSDYRDYINKLSAYLYNYPDKSYRSHYGTIVAWFTEDKLKYKHLDRGRVLPDVKTDGANAPPIRVRSASYDLEKAENDARHSVPPVIKRNPHGLWSPV